MIRDTGILRAPVAIWLLAAGGACLAAPPPVTEELLAPLTSAYMRSVKPGEEAELHRELFQMVLERVRSSYPGDVDIPALIAAALKTIEPLEPESGEPADVFRESINAALAALDPHSYYLPGRGDEFSVSLARETTGARALRWRMDGEVLVLHLASFTGQVSAALEKAVADAAAVRPPRAVVLDLRGNLGGMLRQAVKTADAFLTAGEIGSMRGRNPARWRTWRADPVELLAGVPMVVLIDGGSASASELVAAALQENGRATVMGQRSFGKGSVQAIISLGADKGTLYLTTALYHGPSGRRVQRTGVEPDIELLTTPGKTGWEWRREADRALALPGADEPLPPRARVDELRCAAGQTDIDPALACARVFLASGEMESFLSALDPEHEDTRR